jgi:hypothetical protein
VIDTCDGTGCRLRTLYSWHDRLLMVPYRSTQWLEGSRQIGGLDRTQMPDHGHRCWLRCDYTRPLLEPLNDTICEGSPVNSRKRYVSSQDVHRPLAGGTYARSPLRACTCILHLCASTPTPQYMNGSLGHVMTCPITVVTTMVWSNPGKPRCLE